VDSTGAYEDVRAVLVTVDGRLVVERYSGSSAEATHDVASVTKSVMSLLVGIALNEGHLGSVEQTVGELLPDYAASMSAEVASVALQELLTMTAGLPDVEDVPPRALLEGDPVARIVSRPLVSPPGEVFTYSSVGSHLLSAILGEATGRSTLEYAREALFDPLGIETEPAAQPLLTDFPEKLPDYEAARFAWPVDGQGRHLGFCCLKLSATDMLTLGQLMLAGGRWNGEQVVPADWVTESTRRHIDTAGLNPAAESYGYQWWVTTADGHPAYAALGFGGQVLAVVPELDLVMVVATEIPDVPRVQAPAFLALLDQILAPALQPS
jgi:CubicO group peptidase (beta-lactamase class C family)